MDTIKLLEGSDSLIAAAQWNEKLPGNIQNIFVMVAQSLDPKKNAGNTLKSQAMS